MNQTTTTRFQAFHLAAGRCSAEQAAALKKMRDEHDVAGSTWGEFCTRELRVSPCDVNRIVGWLEEFGEAYFDLTQLTPVSPEEYRALAPVIVDHRLQLNGQSIALTPEKAEKVASAIAEMRKTATAARARGGGRFRPDRRITTSEPLCNPLKINAHRLWNGDCNDQGGGGRT